LEAALGTSTPLYYSLNLASRKWQIGSFDEGTVPREWSFEAGRSSNRETPALPRARRVDRAATSSIFRPWRWKQLVLGVGHRAAANDACESTSQHLFDSSIRAYVGVNISAMPGRQRSFKTINLSPAAERRIVLRPFLARWWEMTRSAPSWTTWDMVRRRSIAVDARCRYQRQLNC
jgi:hypothetical protein